MSLWNQPTFNETTWDAPPINLSPRAVPKVAFLPYVRRYLNDPNGKLWDDAYLLGLISQAETALTEACNTVWIRFPLNIQNNVALYDLGAMLVKNITRITYRGFKVDLLTQKELALLSPVYRTQQSRPRWATLQFEGFYALRLYPVPSEDLPIIDDISTIYTDKNILNNCVVSAYVFPDETSPLFYTPDYFIRRVVKYYVLWKAFGKEGLGQATDVSLYYKKHFDVQIEKIIKQNSKVYNMVEKQLANVAIQRPWRMHHPLLPPNYGTPVRF